MNVAVIGTGNVGSALLFHLVDVPSVNNIIVINQQDEWSIAAIMDVVSAKPESGTRLTNAPLKQLREADVIALTSGAQMQKGQSGKDVLEANRQVVNNLLDTIPLKKDAIVIALATPVDDITAYIQKRYNLQPSRVLGFGGDLDRNRLAYVLNTLGLPYQDIAVVGEHGQRLIPVYPGEQDFDEVAAKVRNFLGKITAHGGSPRNIATGLLFARLIDSIVNDRGEVHYVSTSHPDYGLYLTWPCELGRNGVRALRPVNLPPKAKEALNDLVVRKRGEL